MVSEQSEWLRVAGPAAAVCRYHRWELGCCQSISVDQERLDKNCDQYRQSSSRAGADYCRWWRCEGQGCQDLIIIQRWLQVDGLLLLGSSKPLLVPGLVVVDVVISMLGHSRIPHTSVLRLIPEAHGDLARLVEAERMEEVVLLNIVDGIVSNTEDHLHVVWGTISSNSSVDVSLCGGGDEIVILTRFKL